MKREYTVIIEKGDSGMLIGTVPAVRGCFTQGKDMDELLENVRDVLSLCLEELGDEADQPMEFVGIHKVAV